MLFDPDARTLILAPHADDESLGCGGLAARRSRESNSASFAKNHHALLISWSDVNIHQGGWEHRDVKGETRRREFHAACETLAVTPLVAEAGQFDTRHISQNLSDLIALVESLVDKHEIQVLLAPDRSFHQDHEAVFRAAMAACRPRNLPSLQTFATYEISNYTWHAPGEGFEPNVFVDLSAEDVEKKQAACACYESQNLHTERGHDEVKRMVDRVGLNFEPLPLNAADRRTPPKMEAFRVIRHCA